MKILALEEELREIPAAIRVEILKREAAAAWKLQQDGTIREIYLTRKGTKAVIVVESQDMAEAREKLSRLPLVSEGYIEFALYELEPYPGYARLFEGRGPGR